MPNELDQEQQLREAALRYAFDIYKERIVRWQAANGHAPLPLYWDPKLMEYIWMNRKQRRAQK